VRSHPYTLKIDVPSSLGDRDTEQLVGMLLGVKNSKSTFLLTWLDNRHHRISFMHSNIKRIKHGKREGTRIQVVVD